MQIRPFNDCDWDCYAGCESEFPFIATDVIEVTTVDGDGEVKYLYGIVIIDSNLVQIILSDREGEDCGFLNRVFDTVEESMNFVFRLQEKVELSWLNYNGFTTID